MKKLAQVALVLLGSLVFPAACASSAARPSSGASSPATLAVSADEHLARTLFARGVQIYKCTATARAGGDGGGREWTFDAPEADLYATTERIVVIGHHAAGPTWHLDDGSRVTGHVRAKAKAPDGKGVDWLLLDAEGATGPSFAGVNVLRRVDTVGGKAPASSVPCTLGETRRVDYTATYELFVRK